jgi:hypothetical protein
MTFSPAYVIKYWHASNQPDGDGNYILIQGRREGFFSWLLSLIKIEPSVEMRVTRNEVCFSEGSFQGRSEIITPMRGVCSMLWGYEKPLIKALLTFFVLGGFFSSMGFGLGQAMGGQGAGVGVALLGLGLALVVALVIYFLNKVFMVGFVNNSGLIHWIRFKKSVIEGQEVNEQQAAYVSQLTLHLIESKVAGGRL